MSPALCPGPGIEGVTPALFLQLKSLTLGLKCNRAEQPDSLGRVLTLASRAAGEGWTQEAAHGRSEVSSDPHPRLSPLTPPCAPSRISSCQLGPRCAATHTSCQLPLLCRKQRELLIAFLSEPQSIRRHLGSRCRDEGGAVHAE